MFIKDKKALNGIVREVRKALFENGADLKYNTLHQVFARSHYHKTQAALLTSLPGIITLDPVQAALEEEQINAKSQTDSGLLNILKSLTKHGTEYHYLLVRMDLLQTMVGMPTRSYYYDDIPPKSLLHLVQECIGNHYSILGGISVGISGDLYECDSLVFKNMDTEFNEAVNSGTIENVIPPDEYNPFQGENEDSPDGWYPDVGVVSQLFLLKIKPTQVNYETIDSLSESTLNQLNKITFDGWDEDDPFGEFNEFFAGELTVKPIETIQVPDFSEEIDLYEDIDAENLSDSYLQNSSLTMLSSEDELAEGGVLEDYFDTDLEPLLFINSEDVGEFSVQRSHLWALEILGTRYKEKLPIPTIGILTATNPCGGMYFSDDSVQIAVPHYDQFGAGSPELATCVHHGRMTGLKKVFPNALYYCIPNYTWDEIESPDQSELCVPAILNHFGEAFRNWPSDFSMSQSPNQFAFELHGEQLISEHNIKTVCVDDFQECYGDMTGVLIASFYDQDDELVAELSYCVLLQKEFVRGKEPCIELTLDERLKSFCKSHGIEVLWTEHTLNHPYGEREYNQSEQKKGFIISTPATYAEDSTLLMGVKFPTMTYINAKKLNKVVGEFFEYCVKDPDGSREQFDFHTVTKSNLELQDYKSVISEVISARHSEQESFVLGSFFIGGFNLKGMALNERSQSIRNTLTFKADTSHPVDNGWFKLAHEIAKDWCDTLNLPHTSIEVSFFNDPFERERIVAKMFNG